MPKLNSDDGAVFFLEYQLWAITVKIWVFILKYILLAIKWLHHHPEVSLWILVSWAGRHGNFFSIFYNFWSPESRLIEKFVMSIVVSQTEFIKTEIYIFLYIQKKTDCYWLWRCQIFLIWRSSLAIETYVNILQNDWTNQSVLTFQTNCTHQTPKADKRKCEPIAVAPIKIYLFEKFCHRMYRSITKSIVM